MGRDSGHALIRGTHPLFNSHSRIFIFSSLVARTPPSTKVAAAGYLIARARALRAGPRLRPQTLTFVHRARTGLS
jgi:hypothetical protein